MKRPEQLSADDLWELLGAYASTVGYAEGVLFTRNAFVNEACNQFEEENKDDSSASSKFLGDW
jgi:hypothetical protein